MRAVAILFHILWPCAHFSPLMNIKLNSVSSVCVVVFLLGFFTTLYLKPPYFCTEKMKTNATEKCVNREITAFQQKETTTGEYKIRHERRTKYFAHGLLQMHGILWDCVFCLVFLFRSSNRNPTRANLKHIESGEIKFNQKISLLHFTCTLVPHSIYRFFPFVSFCQLITTLAY